MKQSILFETAKPSEFIRMAMNDLERCEKDKRYVVSMKFWHRPVNDRCHICLAGAVMAKTLGADRKTLLKANQNFGLEPAAANKLISLARFSEGRVRSGLDLFHGQAPYTKGSLVKNRNIPSYKTEPEHFKRHMLELAADLDAAAH